MAANYSEAALLGRCANGVAGTVQFLYKNLIGVTVPDTIDSTTKLNTLKNKGYLFAANIEQSTRSYGSGKVGSGEWIHIRLGITWIKVNIREQVFYTIANPDKLPYESDGAAAIESTIRSVLAQAQGYRIVATDTPINVTTPNVLDLTASQRNTGILPNVKFTARMSGAIIGTKISGEVYV